MRESNRLHVWIAEHPLLGFHTDAAQDAAAALNRAAYEAKRVLRIRGVNVLEIIEDFDGDTYRAVYAVRYAETVMFFIVSKRNHHMASLRIVAISTLSGV